MEQVISEDMPTGLVPELYHFSAISNPVEVKDRLQQLIGGRVIQTGVP